MGSVGRVQSPAAKRVIIASADPELRGRVRERLAGGRWQVQEAAGGAEALARLEDAPAAAVLLDRWLPDLEVEELAAMLRQLDPQMEVLRLGEPDSATARGPRSDELRHLLRQLDPGVAAAPATLEAALPAPSAPQRTLVPSPPPRSQAVAPSPALPALTPSSPASSLLIDGLIGASPAMLELTALIRRVAPTLATVLIEGETGTGKEVVAQALHRLSPRAAKPLVVLNCAAIPEALLEAELFGHARGAFTGADRARTGRIEAAHGGTLFLDEIGEMPVALQAKMLRFLEAHELQRVGDNEVVRVNVRVLAATHQDLEAKIAAGGFRLDLYHRLAVFPLRVPPLRERREDIPALATHLLAHMARTAPRKQLSAGAMDALLAHDWPGNVRELAHVLERAAILAGDDPVLHAAHIRLRRTGRL